MALLLPHCVAIDTETTSLNPWTGGRVFSAAACFADGRTLYWRDSFMGLREVLEDESIDKVFHNAKFDLRMLQWSGFKVRGRVWDTMIFGHLLDGRQKLGLGPMSVRYLPIDQRKVITEIEQWLEQHKLSQKYGYDEEDRFEQFDKLPNELLRRRNVGDSELTMGLFKRLYSTVATVFPLLLAQEHKLLHVVSRMEDRGIVVNYEEIELQKVYFTEMIEDVLRFCEGVTGLDYFNINAQKDQKLLIENAGLWPSLEAVAGKDKSRYNKSGPRLDDFNLRNLHHPVAHMMLLGKAAIKMRDTFLAQMQRLSINGVLHPNYKQLGTSTGRFSCSKPNLQNIPIEGDRRTSYTAEEAEEMSEMTGWNYAPHLKRMFEVRPGFCHIHSDKKQAEMAMLAHYTSDPVLMGIFNTGKSVHDEICRFLYGEWTKGLKTRTKAVVFGYMYGAGLETLARKIGGTIREARDTKTLLATKLPSLPRLQMLLKAQIQDRGYIESDWKRRYYIRPSEAYKGVNALCQGSVGDEIKSRMIAIDEWAESEKNGCQLLLNIHDDLCTESPIENRYESVKQIHRLMHETGIHYKLALPSSLDITYTRWADLVELNDINILPEPPTKEIL